MTSGTEVLRGDQHAKSGNCRAGRRGVHRSGRLLCTAVPRRRNGGTTTAGGGFYLRNAPLTLGEGLCFAYYVVLEATWGATLGKLATNIRVVRENDGGPIAWRAAVIRNLLRPIDGLVFYLLGFIVICVSQKRQRIGDEVAGTIVVRRSAQLAPVSSEPK